MNKETYFDFLDEDEIIICKCEVGKRLISLYYILSACMLALTIIFIPINILFIINNPDARTIILGILIIVAFCTITIVLYFYARNLKHREYVLTDKHILFAKGGKIRNYKRMLELTDIKGIERTENIISRSLGVCNIDFFSPSVSASKKTFLKVFTLSSTVFMFQGIKREDADQMMKLTLQMKKEKKND